ncbi:MAG: hypothetical protein GX638_16315 [Crenarchaeota archaeon]|nr:hypothetical protein [Thermoproteota archaeon]
MEWDVIRKTMFHYPDKKEFLFLKNNKKWHEVKNLLKESPVGNPRPYFYYPQSSGNVIHHTYSLINFLDFYDLNICDIKELVLEFGGGYGSFCKIFFDYGYVGNYYIYDQEEFSALQNYYLKSIQLNRSKNLNYNAKQFENVFLLSDLDEFMKNISKEKRIGLFIALWSLSECPLELRDKILNEYCIPQFFFFAFQEKFRNIDNLKFFREFIDHHSDYTWSMIEIFHLPGNYYLYGKRIDY